MNKLYIEKQRLANILILVRLFSNRISSMASDTIQNYLIIKLLFLLLRIRGTTNG